jgi:hypothetical protein
MILSVPIMLSNLSKASLKSQKIDSKSFWLFALSIVLLAAPVKADVLQGNVEKEDDGTRLSRPGGQGGILQSNAQPPQFRLGGPMPAPDFRSGAPLAGLVDTSGFNAPLRGTASDNGGRLGLVQPAQFDESANNDANKKFDLGAERGDHALVLAWERWHHQLSQAIYQRWSEVANRPGSATLKIIVYQNRQLVPVMVRSSGNEHFDHDLIASVMSLNNNPGLSFPAKSLRNQVTFEADYVASTNIRPGFSWVKNDYEKVHESY